MNAPTVLLLLSLACLPGLMTGHLPETSSDTAAVETSADDVVLIDDVVVNIDEETALSAPVSLVVPAALSVYVDGTTSFTAEVIDESGLQRPLLDSERTVIDDGDGSVARAEYYGKDIVLVGMQSGRVNMTVTLEAQSEDGTFTPVLTPDRLPVESVIIVSADD